MRLQRLKINGFKNLNDFELDFTTNQGLTVLIGNNGSGKSNILEAISSIFASLYDSKRKPGFDYEIDYLINDRSISLKYKKGKKLFKVDGVLEAPRSFFSLSDNLPSQIIASYSGEETRLWEDYYHNFYDEYVNKIIRKKLQSIPIQPLLYINKYYWNIALLTFLYSDLKNLNDFCKNVLNIKKLNRIIFHFNTKDIVGYKANPVVNFVKRINPKNEEKVGLTLNQLKRRFDVFEKEFFMNMAAAYMPKDSKLITDITIKFNSNWTTASLSEGEKKFILMKLILEVLSDENSLILLDEPDSHIHVSRKKDLSDLFEEYKNRENVITTHSPTLAHCFDDKYIAMLSVDEGNSVKVEDKEKQHIISELTNDIWNYQEQNIFLSSNKDLLLVEGKTDIIFIKTALAKLKGDNAEYQGLDFEFLPFGGASGLKLFVDKFTPKKGQTIIALLDRDDAGLDSLKATLDFKGNLKEYTTMKKDRIYIALIPYTDGYTLTKFILEDYFGLDYLKEIIFPNSEGITSMLKDKALKNELVRRCDNDSVEKERFEGFKNLFNLIIEIKNKNN